MEGGAVRSRWDYGYQLTELANRTTLIDNLGANVTHIAAVAEAFTAPEAQAWELTRALGAEYVVVVFGGLAAYQSDDLNKLVWMCRLADEHFPTQPR